MTLPADEPADATQVLASEAGALFFARALAVAPRFVLDDSDAAAVAEICRRLDGIPLAVELAAAGVRVLTPPQIAAELRDRFDLLDGGRRRVARHRTLRASMDWSYALLSEPERRMLRRLSVLRGTFDLDAVAALAEEFDGAAGQVLEPLTGLVDKSLVLHRACAGFGLLETVRQYAAGKLEEAGDSQAWLEAQFMLIVGAATGGEPGLAVEFTAHARLSAPRTNPYLDRAVTGFGSFGLLMRGQAAQALGELLPVTERTRALGDRNGRTVASGALAWAAALSGDGETARRAAADSLEQATRGGFGIVGVLSHLGHGMSLLARGDARGAFRALERGRELAGDAPGWADLCAAPAVGALLATGALEQARAGAARCADRVLDPLLPWQAAVVLEAQARIAAADDDRPGALEFAARSLRLRRRIGDVAGAADLLEFLATDLTSRQLPNEASRLLGAAAAMRTAAGCRRFAVHDRAVGATAAAARAALGPAEHAEAFEAGAGMSWDEAVDYALRRRGPRPRADHGWAALTKAERQVAHHVAAGLSTNGIAARLYISPRTVQSHLTRIYDKLEVRSRSSWRGLCQRLRIVEHRGIAARAVGPKREHRDQLVATQTLPLRLGRDQLGDEVVAWPGTSTRAAWPSWRRSARTGTPNTSAAAARWAPTGKPDPARGEIVRRVQAKSRQRSKTCR